MSNCLNNAAKKYLCRFNEILDEMICEMTSADLTNSISHNFIEQMLPHHRAAIKMCENILEYTDCEKLKSIAESIISEQTESIENMEEILSGCGSITNSCRSLQAYKGCFDEICSDMFSGMKSACAVNDTDVDFLTEMLPHHIGAIRMSENALKFNICSELTPILQSIIASQKKGVCEMEKLLKCLTSNS